MRVIYLLLMLTVIGCSVEPSKDAAPTMSNQSEMMLNSELEKHFEGLMIEDFEFKSMTREDDSLEFTWEQVREESVFRISISMSIYSEYYSVDSIDAYISYLLVEDIIAPIFKMHNIPNHNAFTLKQLKSTVDMNEHNSIKSLKVFNEKDGLILRDKAKHFIDDNLLGFFAKYSDLKSGYLEIQKDELSNLVRLVRQPLPFRMMVMKYLEDEMSYKVYVKELLNYYESENNAKNVDIINALKNKLEAK